MTGLHPSVPLDLQNQQTQALRVHSHTPSAPLPRALHLPPTPQRSLCRDLQEGTGSGTGGMIIKTSFKDKGG